MSQFCKTCGVPLSWHCKGDYCTHHRDRTGSKNPFFGKTHRKETIDAAKIKCIKASKNLWATKEYRDKIIKSVSKPRREGFKKEQSARITQWYKDHPEQKDIRRKRMIKSWQEGSIVPGPQHFYRSTSKLEQEFFEKVRKINDEVEKKSLRIDSTWIIPDAIVTRYRYVVEFYGDYWHANPKIYQAGDIVHHHKTAQEIWDRDEERIQKLWSLGYHVHVVWASDYKKDPKRILKMVEDFLEWESCSL